MITGISINGLVYGKVHGEYDETEEIFESEDEIKVVQFSRIGNFICSGFSNYYFLE